MKKSETEDSETDTETLNIIEKYKKNKQLSKLAKKHVLKPALPIDEKEPDKKPRQRMKRTKAEIESDLKNVKNDLKIRSRGVEPKDKPRYTTKRKEIEEEELPPIIIKKKKKPQVIHYEDDSSSSSSVVYVKKKKAKTPVKKVEKKAITPVKVVKKPVKKVVKKKPIKKQVKKPEVYEEPKVIYDHYQHHQPQQYYYQEPSNNDFFSGCF